jgi:hypothetical protein
VEVIQATVSLVVKSLARTFTAEISVFFAVDEKQPPACVAARRGE